jgi:peptidyl-prolyl cis-trans isomerase D
VSVLESMRSGTDSTLMQVVLVLVVVSFVFWYAAPQGDTTQVVFSVNGEEIRDIEYGRAVGQAERGEEQRLGRVLSEPEQARLRQDIREQLIQGTVLLQQAEELGIEVSDVEVARRIYAIPAFRDEDGKFSERLYDNTLRRLRYNQADFEDRIRKDVLREKLRNLVALGGTATESELKAAWVDQNTTLDVEFVTIRPSAFFQLVPIDDSIRAAWLAEHEAEVRQVYEADFQRLYDLPERVRLSAIRLGVRSDGVTADVLAERLAAARAELVAGADFAAVARRASEDPSAARGGDLGLLTLADLAEEVRTALEGLEVGALSEVVIERGQVRLFRLDERLAARQVPFEEVRDEIADRLIREERAPTVAAEYADKLHAAWLASGTAPQAILDEASMMTMSTGPRRAGEVNPMGPPAQMMDDAAEASAGQVLPEIYTQGSTLYVGRLASRGDPDAARFDDEQENLEEQLLAERRREFLTSYVEAEIAAAVIK